MSSNEFGVGATIPEVQGRVVLRGDIAKDDSGAYAVFIEQGSSASQMTAAQVVDVIARLLDCDGQEADAVPAYTQVKMKGARKLLKIPKSECPDVWIPLPRHKWPKAWEYIEGRILWERQFEKALMELGWEKYQIGNACSFTENKNYSYRSMWMPSKWMERSRLWLLCGRN